MTLQFAKMKRDESAFSAAMTFLAARDPFRTMPLGEVTQSVAGSVRRGHYIFVIEAGRIVGLTCWALTDAETARRWTEGWITPSFDETVAGDTVVLMLGGGDHPRVALQGVRHIAGLYPGRAYVMRRFGREAIKKGRFPDLVRTAVPPAESGQVSSRD